MPGRAGDDLRSYARALCDRAVSDDVLASQFLFRRAPLLERMGVAVVEV